LAALYAIAVARAHAFNDGNKRAALGAMRLFLRLNSHRLNASPIEAAAALVAVVEGTFSEAQFTQWVRSHVERL
jgi:death-on-curing protein